MQLCTDLWPHAMLDKNSRTSRNETNVDAFLSRTIALSASSPHCLYILLWVLVLGWTDQKANEGVQWDKSKSTGRAKWGMCVREIALINGGNHSVRTLARWKPPVPSVPSLHITDFDWPEPPLLSVLPGLQLPLPYHYFSTENIQYCLWYFF